MDRDRLSQWWPGQEAMGTSWNTGGSSEHHRQGDWALAQVAKWGCGVPNLEDTQNPSGHGPRQAVLRGPVWTGGWTRWDVEVPPHLSHPVVL